MLSATIKQVILGIPRKGKRVVAIVFDIVVCGLSVWLSFGLRLDYWGPYHESQWWVFLASVGLSLPIFIIFGLYRAIFRYIGSVAFISIVRVFALYTGLFFSIFTLIGIEDVPRSIGIIQPLLLFIGAGTSRYFVRFWLGGAAQTSGQMFERIRPNALIYGAGSAGRQLAAGLAIGNQILVRGFIDDDISLRGSTINGIVVLHKSEIQNAIQRLNITDVLLAIPSISQPRRNEVISSLYGCGVRVRTLPGLVDMASGRLRVADLHDLDMNDLLGREVVPPDPVLLEKNIKSKTILVTGAGGSIGSELCRQIIKLTPDSLILIDSSEHALYSINEELKKILLSKDGQNSNPEKIKKLSINLIPCLASVRDSNHMAKIFHKYKPETVFHAAAYKHVPLLEENPVEGIQNNVFGTYNCARASLDCGVQNFILVSTDKAVRPTNVMGATKRIAELVLQSISANAHDKGNTARFSMVRFGNVLGSSGSVAPLFSSQIKSGGPITLTHPEVTRYFMTIPEAAQLVIQAGAMATGGDVFVLDMGQPVRIFDLAVKMVYLSGLMVKDQSNPSGDIEIKLTGLRPGEKLYEELLIGENPKSTDHPKIMKAHEGFLPWNELKLGLDELELALQSDSIDRIQTCLKKLVLGYRPNNL
jgi:FlaA1/EpsC-like NDP-sugar epimerase